MSSGRTDTSARHRQVARYGDDGAGTPELVGVLPVLMLLVTVCLQFALWALASNALSDSVAQAGASLRAEGGTSAGARDVALQEIGALASGLVLRPTVSTQNLPEGTASLSGSGAVPSLLPGERLTVSSESTGPDQQFRASG